MKAGWRLAVAAAALAAEVQAGAPAAVPAGASGPRALMPGDPRGMARPSWFGRRRWVRWYCNDDGSNCLVIRRHRSRLACQRAMAYYLGVIRGRDARCTFE